MLQQFDIICSRSTRSFESLTKTLKMSTISYFYTTAMYFIWWPLSTPTFCSIKSQKRTPHSQSHYIFSKHSSILQPWLLTRGFHWNCLLFVHAVEATKLWTSRLFCAPVVSKKEDFFLSLLFTSFSTVFPFERLATMAIFPFSERIVAFLFLFISFFW